MLSVEGEVYFSDVIPTIKVKAYKNHRILFDASDFFLDQFFYSQTPFPFF